MVMAVDTTVNVCAESGPACHAESAVSLAVIDPCHKLSPGPRQARREAKCPIKT